VKVIVRHSSTCKDKGKGAEWRKCRCSKTLLVYKSDQGENRRISAKTRSWERAEDAAQVEKDIVSDSQRLVCLLAFGFSHLP